MSMEQLQSRSMALWGLHDSLGGSRMCGALGTAGSCWACWRNRGSNKGTFETPLETPRNN